MEIRGQLASLTLGGYTSLFCVFSWHRKLFKLLRRFHQQTAPSRPNLKANYQVERVDFAANSHNKGNASETLDPIFQH